MVGGKDGTMEITGYIHADWDTYMENMLFFGSFLTKDFDASWQYDDYTLLHDGKVFSPSIRTLTNQWEHLEAEADVELTEVDYACC
jgi:hypothetical protein